MTLFFSLMIISIISCIIFNIMVLLTITTTNVHTAENELISFEIWSCREKCL